MSAPGGKNERASRARRAGEQGFHASDSTDAPRPARHAAASYAAISTMWEALCGRLAQRHPVSRPQRALRDARRGYNMSRYLGIKKGKINAPCARDGMLPIFASGSPVQRALRACATAGNPPRRRLPVPTRLARVRDGLGAQKPSPPLRGAAPCPQPVGRRCQPARRQLPPSWRRGPHFHAALVR